MQLKQTLAKFNQPLKTPDFLDKKYLPSLDGWRAIAVILVILGHAKLTVNQNSLFYKFTETFIYADLGVRFFFVLSGFLITTLLIKEYQKNGYINFKHFYVRRLLRIVPVLYLYVSIIFITNIFCALGIKELYFIAPLLFFNNFILTRGTWVLGHTWTLGIEEQFYMIWPFIFSILIKNAWKFCLIILAAMPIIRILIYYRGEYYYWSLFPFLNGADGIFDGALLSLLCFKGMVKPDFFSKNRTIMRIATSVLLFLIYFFKHRGMAGKILLPFGEPLVDFSIAILIMSSITNFSGLLFKILNFPFMIQAGILSYSLYVWHQLFIIPEGYYANNLPSFIFPFNMLAAIIVAYISYHYFEKYFLKWKEKFASNSTTH